MEVNAAATPLHGDHLAQNLHHLHRFIGGTPCITTQDKAGTTTVASLYTHNPMGNDTALTVIKDDVSHLNS